MQDVDGKEYIDFIAMFSAVNTGHCNEEIMAAVMKQMQKRKSQHLVDLLAAAEYLDKINTTANLSPPQK